MSLTRSALGSGLPLPGYDGYNTARAKIAAGPGQADQAGAFRGQRRVLALGPAGSIFAAASQLGFACLAAVTALPGAGPGMRCAPPSWRGTRPGPWPRPDRGLARGAVVTRLPLPSASCAGPALFSGVMPQPVRRHRGIPG